MPRLFCRTACGLLICLPAGCGAPVPPAPPAVATTAEETPAPPARPPSSDPKPEKKSGDEGARPLVSGTSYIFPPDSGGKLLGTLLPPADPPRLPAPASQRQLVRPIPPTVDRPTLLPPPSVTAPPPVPQPAQPALRPAPTHEPVPSDANGLRPERPSRIVLPVARLIDQRGPDVRKPAALPTLARPVADRASLEDPTAEFSAAGVVGAKMPVRTEPAPFEKVNLPDPFENAAVRLRQGSREDSMALPTPPAGPKPTLR